MKLLRTDNPYLTKDQWRKVFLAMSIMTIALYIIAMVFSLCDSKYFILNYQNEQMDKIEVFLREYKIYSLYLWIFTTAEFFITLSFVLNKIANFIYALVFYAVAMIIAALFPSVPVVFYQIYPVAFYLLIPLIEQLIEKPKGEKFNWKLYWRQILRLLIAVAVIFSLQIMIYVIKAGYFSVENHIMNMSATFIYALEYDIALLVLLMTIALYIDKGKGDSKLWVTFQAHGSSSQTTKKNSLKLSSELTKNLTKTQRNRLIWFWIRFYAVQILGFLLLMVLPFLLGKVLEFLMMYLSFAIARYILGFKYSLHFKKENVCITVGALVFGILTLAVPFFYVVVIIAVVFGVGLAVLLHLSYKYKGMYLFNLAAKPDKFALLYTYFDGELEPTKVRNKCRLRGLDNFQIDLVADFVEGNKIMYLAKKYNYSQRMLIYKLDEAIDKLLEAE